MIELLNFSWHICIYAMLGRFLSSGRCYEDIFARVLGGLGNHKLSHPGVNSTSYNNGLPTKICPPVQEWPDYMAVTVSV